MFIRNKMVYFAILDNVQNIQSEGTIGDIISKFEKASQIDFSDDLGIEYFENFDNHLKELTRRDDKMPFGFEWLDQATCGGLPLHDTCLFIVMAKPGLGKSQFMMNIAANWVAHNKKVLMISLEMSEHMYSRRMDGLFADLNINTLHDNIDILKSRVNGFKAGVPNAQLQIKEFPTGTLTPLKLKQCIKKLKQTRGFVPDIIFVDYLNIMRPNGGNASSLSLYEKSGRIAEELRAISSELKIPVVTATQQSRSANGYAGENVDMSNVSESSGISATADVMVALFVEDGDREVGRKNLKIIKNRLGKFVDMHCILKEDPDSLRMSDWTTGESVNDEVFGDVEVENELPKSKRQQQAVEDDNNGLDSI